MDGKSGSYIRKLVVTGALGALTVFLSLTKLGLLPWFSGASITILHIPAIIGAILEGPVVGTGVGAIFGIFAILIANISPNGPVDLAFRNPLVSVLPRILFPVVAWGLYTLLSRRRKIPAIIIASVCATIVHTLLVLGMLVATNGSGILTGNAAGVTIWAVVGTILVANGIPEAIAAGVLVTLIVSAWLGLSSGKRKSKLNS
jgi:uncharacterized membrane protein